MVITQEIDDDIKIIEAALKRLVGRGALEDLQTQGYIINIHSDIVLNAGKNHPFADKAADNVANKVVDKVADNVANDTATVHSPEGKAQYTTWHGNEAMISLEQQGMTVPKKTASEDEYLGSDDAAEELGGCSKPKIAVPKTEVPKTAVPQTTLDITQWLDEIERKERAGQLSRAHVPSELEPHILDTPNDDLEGLIFQLDLDDHINTTATTANTAAAPAPAHVTAPTLDPDPATFQQPGPAPPQGVRPGTLICPYWVSGNYFKWGYIPCGNVDAHDHFVHRRVPGLRMERLECPFHRAGFCKRGDGCKFEHKRTLHGITAPWPHESIGGIAAI